MPSPTTTSAPELCDPAHVRELGRRAEALLHRNWRSGRRRNGMPYAFTIPAAPRYRHQWYWDSCFHAIAWRHFDPWHAREELRTLLRAGDEHGFVPHTVFWDHPPRWRRAPLYATPSSFGAWRTASIGPPVLALAWELVAEASREEDPGFRTEALAALERHHDWLAEHRDPDGDGLLTIVLPDESGLDDSPKYDPVFRWMRHDRPGYAWLVRRCGSLGWDARRIVSACDEHVEDVLVNVLFALSSRALWRLGGDERHALRADRVEAALLERCWDPAAGLFWDLAGRREEPVRISTWASLSPLALPGLPEEIGRRLVESHLLDPRRYRAAVGIPSVAMDEPSFNPRFDRWRSWRGPSWVNTAWLLVPALRRLGYDDHADAVVASLAGATHRHGFREYYNPLTGRGLAARGFGWSTLLHDLALDAP